MGWKNTKAVWDSALDGRLKPMAAVIAHIVFDQNKGDRPANTLFAQMSTLAEYRGVHLTAARKQIQGLERLGVLEVVEAGGGRRWFGAGRKKRIAGVATVYIFHPEKLPACPSENASESASHSLPKTLGSRARTLAESPGSRPAYPPENARALTVSTDLTEKKEEVPVPVRCRADAYSASHDLADALPIVVEQKPEKTAMTTKRGLPSTDPELLPRQRRTFIELHVAERAEERAAERVRRAPPVRTAFEILTETAEAEKEPR